MSYSRLTLRKHQCPPSNHCHGHVDQEVVFQCRDEGPIRARVEWKRANGAPLPPGSRDHNGRLEMPNIKMEHGGTYVCVAKDFPFGTPGAEIAVQLHVEKGKLSSLTWRGLIEFCPERRQRTKGTVFHTQVWHLGPFGYSLSWYR